MKREHSSGIVMGQRYRDTLHDRLGHAVAVHEYMHGRTLVSLEWITGDGGIDGAVFDIDQLEPFELGQ